MIIMIIFLILSFLFIIATVIYLNIKKNQKNTKYKESIKYTNENFSKRKTKKQLANILQIKIKDNIICLGNRYSSIIRLGSIDYNMLSVSEQGGKYLCHYLIISYII